MGKVQMKASNNAVLTIVRSMDYISKAQRPKANDEIVRIVIFICQTTITINYYNKLFGVVSYTYYDLQYIMDIELKEIKYQKFNSISEAGNVKDCPVCHVCYNSQQNKQISMLSQLTICNTCFSNQFMQANNHDGCQLRNNSTINFNQLYYKGIIMSRRIKQMQSQIYPYAFFQQIKKYKLIFLINLLVFVVLLLIIYGIIKYNYNHNQAILKAKINDLQKQIEFRSIIMDLNSTLTLDLSQYSSEFVQRVSRLNLPNLKNLILNNINLSNKHIDSLKNMHLSNLQYLSLRNCSMTPQKLKLLSEINFSSLRSLDFSDNNISWEGFYRISLMNLQKLVDLSLGYNNLQTKDENQSITINFKNLKNINLRNNKLDFNVFNLLVIKSLNITLLNLKNNKLTFINSTNFFKFYSSFQYLKTLDLSSNPIGNTGFSHFTNIKYFSSLAYLNLMNTSLTDDIAANLKNLNINSLIYFNLKYNRIGDNCMKVMSELKFTTLEYLGLYSNNINDVYNVRKINIPKLNQIDLRRNNLSNTSKSQLINEFGEKVIF